MLQGLAHVEETCPKNLTMTFIWQKMQRKTGEDLLASEVSSRDIGVASIFD